MNILRNAALALTFTLVVGPALAQNNLSVSCDAGQTVTISYDDGQGHGPTEDTWRDYDGNGSVEFCVPDGITVVTVTKISDRRVLTYKVHMTN